MKKLINRVEDMIAESQRGFGRAHGDILEVRLDPKLVLRREPRRDKVALISGGGSGHEPLHDGYVGHGPIQHDKVFEVPFVEGRLR